MRRGDTDDTLPRDALADDRTIPASATSSPDAIQDPDIELDALLATTSRYAYGAPLGEGGMGEVHLARDRRFGRDVAIKAMRVEHEANDALRWRFIREARVQGQLEHPSIVPVYDLGRDPSGRAYFTMRRIRGDALDAIIERLRARDPATLAEHTQHKLLAAFVRVCLAIGYAHSRGVVHRDLKPANVMLGAFGEVYVLDWGLAKVKTAQRSLDAPAASLRQPDEVPIEADARAETQAGHTLGTPAYMAPEQARGDADAIGPASDVYALGAILFEILTLEPLHGEGSPAALVMRAMKGVDARASVRTPAREVPPELEAACVRATALDPAARHPSARALADAVEAYLSGDRDQKLRRELAAQHLSRARDAVKALATRDDPEVRRDAVREVGRGLALAPDDHGGLALLARLLTDVPKQVPAEVVAAVEAAVLRPHSRIRRRVTAVLLATCAILAPLCVWFGIHDARLATATLLMWILAAAVAFGASRADRKMAASWPYTSIAYGAAVGVTTLTFGTFVFAPAIGIAVAVLYVMSAPRRQRTAAVLFIATLGFLVPIALAWLGLHPVVQRVEGDVLSIHAGAVRLTTTSVYVLLTIAHLLVGLVATFLAGAYRDVATAGELRTQTLAWNLRQLVPVDPPITPRR